MNKAASQNQFRSKKFGFAVLVLLHTIGAFGFVSPLSQWFVFLTPVNLVVTAGIIYIDTVPGKHTAWPIALFIAVMGYVVEIAGVKTGLLFGNYQYGEVLGWKFFEAPPIIGVNWLIVVWGGFSLAYSLKVPMAFRWLVSAAFITALDFLIEPVAVHFGFWSWADGVIPFQNYVGWFVLASIMSLIFEFYPLVHKPRMGIVALVCQFLFFGALAYYIS